MYNSSLSFFFLVISHHFLSQSMDKDRSLSSFFIPIIFFFFFPFCPFVPSAEYLEYGGSKDLDSDDQEDNDPTDISFQKVLHVAAMEESD